MLTRIEVDGFKNLLGFSAEFGPFTCIAGPNAVGKSNLFDAIEFLSLLAEYPLEEAAQRVRATPGSHEPARALFWNDGEVWVDRIRIAVELIAKGVVVDDLGRADVPRNPSFRYEIELRFDRGLRLVGERLVRLGGTASELIHFPHHPSFAQAHRLDRADGHHVVFDIVEGPMPDRSSPPDLDLARRTVLQLYNTIEHLDILAVRQEISSWRRLALEPADLRKPHVIGSATRLSSSGEHLPLLFMQLLAPDYPGLSYADAGETPSALSAAIVARLRPITSLRSIRIDEDVERQLLTIRVKTSSGEELPARTLSDGTLRCLALVLLGIASGDHVFCIEEPENGIHPDRIDDLIDILLDLFTNPEADVSDEIEGHRQCDWISLRQLIINTHSQQLVKRLFTRNRDDLLMATTALIAGPQGHDARVLRLNPIRETWRCRAGIRGVMSPVFAYAGAAARGDAATNAAEDDG
jgi:hypothetical protein